ncbi:MAG TPA: acetoacetate decarboxylase family protein [Streptosporangiaceae bacterium]|nr:acetoacetate decarboxylase family protein [Streptosporangiaceae bacterium]
MSLDPADRLQGYCLPLSPSGTSSLIPAPPWHFACDALWVSCRVNPEAARDFLPPGLRPPPDPGAAAVGFFEWQWCTDSGAELRDPVRAQFKEALIALDCLLGDEPVVRVPYAWVDNAVSLVRGFVQGMPKSFGSIWLTRGYPVGRAGSRRGPGGEFGAVVSADGRRLASAAVTLAESVPAPPYLSDRPMIHSRHFPGWGPALPATESLVRSAISNAEFGEIWRGDATLEFHDIADQDLARLAPVEVGPGYVFSYAETLSPGSLALG